MLASRVKKAYRIFREIGIFKTLYLNFKYLKFREALKLPILCSKYVRLRRTSGKITIEKPSTGCIRFGMDSVGIFDNRKSRSIIEISDGSELIFKGKAGFGNGFKMCLGGGKLVVGQRFTLTAESSIVCYDEIEFGNDCLLSWDILVMDTDFHKIYSNENRLINPNRKITVGDNVWIGCRATILKGSSIPSGSIVAANSVVSGKLDEQNAIYAGSPSIKIKSSINWKP